jgi:hypothetical protein
VSYRVPSQTTGLPALTLAILETRVGKELMPAPGFLVLVSGTWTGRVTAVLGRTVVVQDPRIERDNLCRQVVRKIDVTPLDPDGMRWVRRGTGGTIVLGRKAAHMHHQCLTTAQALERAAAAS